MSTISHARSVHRDGYLNSITAILDIRAGLDSERQESLIDYWGQLAEKQQTEQRTTATV